MEFYEPEAFRTQHKVNRQASNDEMINPNIISIMSNRNATMYDSFTTSAVTTDVINSKFKRWLFNGDYHVYSDSIPNFP